MPAGPAARVQYGAVEAGGTKFICGIGSGPDDLRTVHIPTESPAVTIRAVIEFFRAAGEGQLAAIGIGSFGPASIDPRSPSWGHITTTPKTGWRHCDLAGPIRAAFGVPVGFDTDVNAAVLAEARWGAARNVDSCLYMTVGTGIGGGAISSGHLVRGISHPEMGHIRIPHDWAADPFPGSCPYHGDCLEGLASGPAIQARWGQPAEELSSDHPAWKLEAHYLALGIANLLSTLSSARVVLGGGVTRHPWLLRQVRADVRSLINEYIAIPGIVPPALGERAGVCGALILAEQSLPAEQSLTAKQGLTTASAD